MKANAKFTAVGLLAASLVFSSCDSGGGGAAAPDPFDDPVTPGEVISITVGSETVDMIYANNQASITFPFSPTEVTPADDQKATLTRKFFLSKTQVTNALMAEVLQWAYGKGKFSATETDPNGLDATTVKHGGQRLLNLAGPNAKIDYSGGIFSVDIGFEDHPVVYVTWYGAVMFCNWLTEMRDGNAASVVYTGIDSSWLHTETIENADRTGYRLPSSEEREYAARYIGTTAPTLGNLPTEYIAQSVRTGHIDLTAGYYWTPAAYVSGATKDNTFEAESRAVAWYQSDPAMGGDKLMPVAGKAANQLGLYDMSGNAFDWCSTMDGADRVVRGSSYGVWVQDARVGYWFGNDPISQGFALGVRFSRTQ